MTMTWCQKNVTLPAYPRGFHLITHHIAAGIPDMKAVCTGLLHVFIQHTSASLTVNENASADVRVDMESLVNSIVPEDFPYVHYLEGVDDMPAHMKASLFGPSLTVPVRDGRMALGTWQGIYLCEHRDHGGRRRLVLTLHGEEP